MSRATVVIESVENYYDIIHAIQENFNLAQRNQTINGLVFEDTASHDDVRITGRIDDDEETTTVIIECGDQQTAQDIEKWVKSNFA